MLWTEGAQISAEIERLVVEHLDGLTTQQLELARTMRRERKDFRNAVYEKWKPALNMFDMFLKYCDDLQYSLFVKHIDQAKREQDVVFLVLGEINLRASRTASEIRILLLNGFGLGAFAHWRTLYELLIVTGFIAKYGRHVADAYYQFAIVDETKALRFIANYRKRKGITLTPEQERGLEQREIRKDELYKEFGASDRDTYPWAKKILKAPTLYAMKEDISEHEFWGYYLEANTLVHASPTGTRLSQVINPLFATSTTSGPSLEALTDAAEITIEVLQQIMKTLLNMKPDVETFANLEALHRFGYRTIEVFKAIG
jgi:hypothetical protein